MELETSWLSLWDGRDAHMRVATPAGGGQGRLCEWYGSLEEGIEVWETGSGLRGLGGRGRGRGRGGVSLEGGDETGSRQAERGGQGG